MLSFKGKVARDFPPNFSLFNYQWSVSIEANFDIFLFVEWVDIYFL